jgi:amidase/6-aminohexanoate-cyclic-dimer hydrolase
MTGFKDYGNYDALGLAELIRARDVSGEEVLEAAIERVEAVNPQLNAVIHKMYDEARQTLAAGLPDGPFAGVPFMLKDLGVFYRGVPTTAGSRIFADFVPDHDSTVVERYRAAGLVIMAKTNTPEFGAAGTTEPVLHGPTRNPWNLDRSSGGSSGGSAAAVAAGMLPMAHATDGGGSIRIPAAQCGLFGLKPTRGRNPAGPDQGEGNSGLSVGHCVSRTVRDSAALLDATQGPEAGAPYMAPPPARPFLDEVGRPPERLRIGFTTTALDGSPIDGACVAATEAAAALLTELGHEVDPARPDLDVAKIRQVWRVIIGVNLWNTLAVRAASLGREPAESDVEPATWALANEGRQRPATDYVRAVQDMHAVGRQLARFFEGYDLLLSTTMARPPIVLGQMDMTCPDLEDYYERQLMDELPFTPLSNETGGPAMSVPLHWTDDGLPVGVHFAGRFGEDETLLRLAGQLEAARPWADRRPPVWAG